MMIPFSAFRKWMDDSEKRFEEEMQSLKDKYVGATKSPKTEKVKVD